MRGDNPSSISAPFFDHMPKKKKKRSRRKAYSGAKVVAGLIALVLIGGAAAVKFFLSPGGKLFLLDRGFTVCYSSVQEHVGRTLREELYGLGLGEDLEERTFPLPEAQAHLVFLKWEAMCKEECDLIKINLALNEAVSRAGARVRSGREEAGGEVLVLDVGSRKYLTHRIVVHRGGSPARRIPEEETKTSPRVSLVIDDFGYSRNHIVDAFLELDFPITISVLPSLPFSSYVASRAKANGKSVILHLPMEPDGAYVGDIPAVLTSMGEREIEDLVERYLGEVPEAEGVNNHMGSKATQDPRVVHAVLTILRKRRLFFLDSLTSNKSIAYNTAKTMGLRAARNDVFLDADTQDRTVIEKRLRHLVSIATERGWAVGIGHPRRHTLDVLRDNEDFLRDCGVSLVFLSELVD